MKFHSLRLYLKQYYTVNPSACQSIRTHDPLVWAVCHSPPLPPHYLNPFFNDYLTLCFFDMDLDRFDLCVFFYKKLIFKKFFCK